MLPRFTATPIEDHRIEFAHDGKLITRWHFGKHYPGPFFYPISTPRGGNLTRMGHPGAPDHDHHRSVWFAHNDLYGHDFWSAQSTCRIEQKSGMHSKMGKQRLGSARVSIGSMDTTRIRWFSKS